MDPRIIDALRSTIAGLLEAHPELADDEALRADTLEGATDLHWIVSRLIVTRREDLAEEGAMRKLAADYLARAAAAERRAEAKRALLHSLMDAAHLHKIKVVEGTATVVPGRPGVTITDEAALPEWAWRVKREVSKTAIADAFKDGLPCPGAVMSNGAPHLRIT